MGMGSVRKPACGNLDVMKKSAAFVLGLVVAALIACAEPRIDGEAEPPPAEPLIERARLAAFDEDFASAIDLYEQAERRDPTLADGELLRMWSSRMQYSSPEDAALIADPANVPVAERVLAALRRANEKTGWREWPWTRDLVELEVTLGDLAGAREALANARAADPRDLRPEGMEVGLLLHERRVDEALEKADELLVRAADQPTPLFLVGLSIVNALRDSDPRLQDRRADLIRRGRRSLERAAELEKGDFLFPTLSQLRRIVLAEARDATGRRKEQLLQEADVLDKRAMAELDRMTKALEN